MQALLLLVPLLTGIFGMLIYRFQDGKKQLFKLDLVQFIYLFVMSPALFVWLKTFLFYLLRNELDLSLTINDVFVIDTVYSIGGFYLFGAISMHTLTKTFWLRRHHDPEFDIYHLSEYFHLWWTHLAMTTGVMAMFSFLSLNNAFFPIDIYMPKVYLFGVLLLGLIMGVVGFFAVWMADSEQGNFMKLMKIEFAFFFLLHIIVYFVFNPEFNSQRSLYWLFMATFFSLSVCSLFFERHEKINKIRQLMLHVGWGDNKGIKLFEQVKKKRK